MKKRILICFSVLASINLFAQDDDGFEAVITAGAADANTLMGAYIAPAMEGLVYSMSGGWYHTAKTHKKLGFDITIGVNAAMVPSDRKSVV